VPVPIFVNCRDRLEPLLQLLAWIEAVGETDICLIDNDSVYPPLLEFYDSCAYEVVRLGRNVGRLALFVTPGLLDRVGERPFVYTDPDVVPVENCPDDALDRFADLLGRYPDVMKVGFGLVIDDLPRHYRHRRAVLKWERKFWRDEVEPGVFRAPIDTTFALYRGGTRQFGYEALRMGRPYVARHTTWYVDEKALTEEERAYRRRVLWDTEDSPESSDWGQAELSPKMRRAVSFRGRLAAKLRALH
jgi:hypothetical protein